MAAAKGNTSLCAGLRRVLLCWRAVSLCLAACVMSGAQPVVAHDGIAWSIRFTFWYGRVRCDLRAI
jgi:hypothetical protein